MKNAILFLYCLTISFVSFSNDTLIWRSIGINNGKAIALTAPVSTVEDVSLKDSKKHYHLLPGSFTGADSISFITQNNFIVEINFHYGEGHTFDEYLSIFQKALQKEALIVEKKNGTRIASWQDPFSRFSLFFVVSRKTTSLFSRLEDL